jgi:hypothetical protein
VEFAIAQEHDGILSQEPLLAFMSECKSGGIGLDFELGGFDKAMNADVAVKFVVPHAEQREIVVKFHNRPLHEVVEYEKAHGEVVPVPLGYFSLQEDGEEAADIITDMPVLASAL